MPSADTSVESFSSIHTNNFPDILRKMGISILVSTYQAGRLVVLRPDGQSLNTHFIAHQKSMGMAGNTTLA